MLRTLAPAVAQIRQAQMKSLAAMAPKQAMESFYKTVKIQQPTRSKNTPLFEP
jgi:hypothetical protein